MDLHLFRDTGRARKWQAPTFIYKGNIASFFSHAKTHASLMFHKGASLAGDFLILQGDENEARTFKVTDQQDLDAKATELQAICIAWCAQQDGV